jgi:hypothetical protein
LTIKINDVITLMVIIKFYRLFWRVNMPGIRGKAQSSITFNEVKQEATNREHVLIKAERSKRDQNIVPKQGKISLRCTKCGNEWETKTYVYLERKAPSNGCRKCYETMSLDPSFYPNSPLIPKNKGNDKPGRKAHKEALRKAHSMGNFSYIKNYTDLINYLKSNPNKYNTPVLELMQREYRVKQERKKMKEILGDNNVAYHHIIPLHAGGSPDRWNMVGITHREHYELHKARYELYNEPADLLSLYGAKTFMDSVEGNIQEPLPKKTKQEIHGVANLAPEVSKALKNGMVWTHRDGFIVKIEPNSLDTMKKVTNALASALPDLHPDKVRILQNKTSTNYLRAVIITKFFDSKNAKPLLKSKDSAYGFTVKPL